MLKDLTGKIFGRLFVICAAPRNKNRQAMWHCWCACGNSCIKPTVNLKNSAKSCGCLLDGRQNAVKHGEARVGMKSARYRLREAAKHRAKDKKLEFSLQLEDIVIPDACPVLGIPLFVGNRNQHDNAPTIDRVNPAVGYTKENIQVISWRANRLKSDASLEELKKIVSYVETVSA